MTEDRRRAGPAERAGLSVPEYERRVWDMTRHLVHPAFVYVVLQVVGIARLVGHPSFHDPGVGLYREWGLFLASFLGAWAVFYSTLLRTSGLRSLTVTFLVPAAALGLVAVWVAFPPVAEMTGTQLLVACAALAGPGVVAWPVTMIRWRRARREVAHLLEEDPAP